MFWKLALAQLLQTRADIAADADAARQHAKGRLSARERIAALLDPQTQLDELMIFAAWQLYPEHTPAAGVITGIGCIAGQRWMIIANDATVKAGAFFPMTAKKVIRAQTIALENHLPVVYLVDSAGVYLPMQDEIFPDQDDFGRVFYLNARLSALGIPQISAIMGACVAGGAYLPVMSDTLIMTEGSGLYLAGPALVQAAIGQIADPEALGGAHMHASVSGTVDYHEPDDAHALARIRALAALYPTRPVAAWAQARQSTLAASDPQDPSAIVGFEGQPYEVHHLLNTLVDAESWQEFRAEYGESVVCGWARLGGFAVGMVANQRRVVKHQHAGHTRLEMGGVIYAESAEKAARFVLEANQMAVPLVFLSDVTGFMVGVQSEQQGIIRQGAKLIQAISNSVVPRFTVIVGGSYGAGHYAMNGKAYAPRFIYAWPNAKYGVMAGAAAAKTLLSVQLAQLRKQGRTLSEAEQASLQADILSQYQTQLDPYYAASRLWVDDIILPSETRSRLISALESCVHSPIEPWRLGLFQV